MGRVSVNKGQSQAGLLSNCPSSACLLTGGQSTGGRTTARVGWLQVNLPEGPVGQALCVRFPTNQQTSVGPGSWILPAPFYRHRNGGTVKSITWDSTQVLDTLVWHVSPVSEVLNFFPSLLKKINQTSFYFFKILPDALTCKTDKEGGSVVHGGEERPLSISLSPQAPLWNPKEPDVRTSSPDLQFPCTQGAL